MFDEIAARIRQGKRTIAFPRGEPVLPELFRGLPAFGAGKCAAGCRRCMDACPCGAIEAGDGKPAVDMGKCLFCTDCAAACGTGGIGFSREHRIAASRRGDLIFRGGPPPEVLALGGDRGILKRSFKLRQVSAAGCNACEADVNVLNTVVFDLGRFGVQFVASPRHADGILVTGPVSRNMLLGLKKTWEAVPSPKAVIAVGACAISGGIFAGGEVMNGVDGVLPVDLYVPGCPPHPITILDGILRLLGRAG